jgi:2-dehydropantoate 2-reductase
MEAVTIIGAGGIGCAIGYALCSAGWPVTFVDTDARKIEWGRTRGVAVDGRSALTARFEYFAEWPPPEAGIVFLCTKCYDNAAVLSSLPQGVTLIPVQNGFDAQLEAREHALEGIAAFVSECPADRPHPRITRPGRLYFGPRLEAPSLAPTVSKLVDAFRDGRVFGLEVVSHIEPYKYTKLLYNAAISPIAAAAGIDNGKLLSVPLARRLFFALMQENYSILSNAGIELGTVGPCSPRTVAGILKRRWLARLFAWAFEPSLRGTYCSMAPDLPKGRTEIDYYNQRLIDLAGNTPCPLNRAAVALIKRMESERIIPQRGMLDELARAA